ncbi:MAG: 16S rRNA (guanine(527)-N(7))-methyltransferase RsmG [Rhodobacteraceae bacterium]|nr:16S rRNA (guanine(527)-N(7))-methyltransferase RsmG [Paracoccaceae bacterium]
MIPREFSDRIDVSRETAERLEAYAALLQKWNPRINLVSAASLPEMWTRHFLDSAQLMELAPARATHWVDFGSGGGFPGVVVAILSADRCPKRLVTLVESDARKAAFLLNVVRETGVTAKVIVDRAERLDPFRANIVSARALAPLGSLLSLAEKHLSHDGIALFPKGADHDAEIERALESWRFSVQKAPSLTDPASAVLRIEGISRV